jgi:hypothetical protein
MPLSTIFSERQAATSKFCDQSLTHTCSHASRKASTFASSSSLLMSPSTSQAHCGRGAEGCNASLAHSKASRNSRWLGMLLNEADTLREASWSRNSHGSGKPLEYPSAASRLVGILLSPSMVRHVVEMCPRCFEMFSKCFRNVFELFRNVFEMFSKSCSHLMCSTCFRDVFEMFSKCFRMFSKCVRNVFEMFSKCVRTLGMLVPMEFRWSSWQITNISSFC